MKPDPWWTQALCAPEHRPAGIGPEWWTEQPRGLAWGQGHQRLAIRVCNSCPVRFQCLEDSLRHEHGPAKYRWGIFGGYTPAQRAAMSRCSCGVALYMDGQHDRDMWQAHARICSKAAA